MQRVLCVCSRSLCGLSEWQQPIDTVVDDTGVSGAEVTGDRVEECAGEAEEWTEPDQLFLSAQDALLSDEPPTALAARIASKFDLEAPIEAFDFPEKGNINRETFEIHCGRDGAAEYLLQRINQRVFTRPERVMAAMLQSLEAQRQSLADGKLPAGREWEVVSLVSTRRGAPYLVSKDRRGTTHWRLMVKIPDCRTYKSLGEIADRSEQLQVASEAGRGLALYSDFTASVNANELASPLPGYRDTKIYFDQFTSVLSEHRTLEEAESLLPRDATVRDSTREHFLVTLTPREFRRRLEDPDVRELVELLQSERHFGELLQREMQEQRIRTVAVHGDTKLENFLFSATTGRVKALVDLDTIMPQTWLSDWGDMVRSLANVAGEKERDLDRVSVDMDVYEAVARGFLSTAREVTAHEVSLMVEAVEIIALELGLRFLTDYIRGDSYFKLGPADPPDLNKVRGRVQLTLFSQLRAVHSAASASIESLVGSVPRAARDTE